MNKEGNMKIKDKSEKSPAIDNDLQISEEKKVLVKSRSSVLPQKVNDKEKKLSSFWSLKAETIQRSSNLTEKVDNINIDDDPKFKNTLNVCQGKINKHKRKRISSKEKQKLYS
jgi:hypothetical protein